MAVNQPPPNPDYGIVQTTKDAERIAQEIAKAHAKALEEAQIKEANARRAAEERAARNRHTSGPR
ncbi:hypothetical protein [Micromonospora sp. NPDC003776]